MTGFSFTGDALICDGVNLLDVVKSEGTPLYGYSEALITKRYLALDAAVGKYPHRIHYALKANSTLGIVRLLSRIGSAFDANSWGEISVACRASVPPKDIVFTGVGKTDVELTQAVGLGIQAINAESIGEVTRINQIALSEDKCARIAIRINPDIDAKSHPGISTGGRSHKFGVPLHEAGPLCREVSRWDGIRLVGVHAHVGSQITAIDPVKKVAKTISEFARTLIADGLSLEHIDLGGGLGISYDGKPTLPVEKYVRTLLDSVAPTGLNLILEPGRWVLGPAGVLLATVVDVKAQNSGRYFVVLDTGMTELMRPALYGAVHRVEPCIQRKGPNVICDVVGPICETTDVIRIGHRMVLPEIGDVLAICDAGAYGAAMASNYNRRSLPAEVLITEGNYQVIRSRQNIDELLACEE
jgi:diaminopimelate decarboxylase